MRAMSFLPGCQPCRCLCRGSEQITRTLPFLRMMRQLRQIFFTDALTFMLFHSRQRLTPPVALQVRLFQHALVLVRHQVGLNLRHEIHNNHHDD